jgi:hypothetical protein
VNDGRSAACKVALPGVQFPPIPLSQEVIIQNALCNFVWGDTTVASVYVHDGGGPDHLGCEILDFLYSLEKSVDPRYDDPEYLAAKFIVFLADRRVSGSKKTDVTGVGATRNEYDTEWKYYFNCMEAEGYRKPSVVCYHISGRSEIL